MQLANLSQTTYSALQQILPSAASLQNPVDMLASASPEQYAGSLQILLTDPAVDGIMVILPPPPMFTAGAVAKAIIPVIHADNKPVVVALMGERLIQEAVEHFRAAHIPEYRFPERAASALAVLAQRHEYFRRKDEQIPQLDGIDRLHARQIFQSFLDTKPDHDWLPASVAEALMACYGIQAPPTFLARTPEEAAEMAVKATLPVVLKVASPEILHKSDVDGVLVDLWDAAAASQGFNLVVERAGRAVPDAHIHGAVLQHMLSPGQDVIIGAIQDPQFGAMVMFGSGGVETEGLKDVAFALAPLTREETVFLLESTWAGRKLAGYRSMPPADRMAAMDVLLRFSQLAADFPELSEIEINPLRVLGDGQGAFALDLRARMELAPIFPLSPLQQKDLQ